MIVELSRMHHPVTVLGHGSRAGIWFQGCSIRCTGCVSRDTWEPRPDSGVDVGSVLAWITELPADQLDGVTISGGEPFDQPDALAELVGGIDELRRQRTRPLDLLCYSGYPINRLEREYADLLALLDVVISEPYVAARAGHIPLRGSANQRVTALSPLGRARYAESAGPGPLRNRFQVDADADSIWYIGIPGPGDMTRLEQLMRDRGVEQGQVSWRS